LSISNKAEQDYASSIDKKQHNPLSENEEIYMYLWCIISHIEASEKVYVYSLGKLIVKNHTDNNHLKHGSLVGKYMHIT